MTRAFLLSRDWDLIALTASSVSVTAHVCQEVPANMVMAATKMTLVETQAMRR